MEAVAPSIHELSRSQESVTDGRTDGRTDRRTDGRTYERYAVSFVCPNIMTQADKNNDTLCTPYYVQKCMLLFNGQTLCSFQSKH